MTKKYEIVRGEPIVEDGRAKLGRGHIMFPEFLELEVSDDYGKGDTLVYPDTPYNRKVILDRKHQYNAREGSFKGRRFSHRYEIRGGEPKIVIQRIV